MQKFPWKRHVALNGKTKRTTPGLGPSTIIYGNSCAPKVPYRYYNIEENFKIHAYLFEISC